MSSEQKFVHTYKLRENISNKKKKLSKVEQEQETSLIASV